MNKKQSRAVIYDFDGTLFNSPTREQGELSYFETTGKNFPFPGWWGRLESLIPPVIPEKPGEEWLIQRTISAYRNDCLDNNTRCVLMTGRPYKNRKRIIEICDHHNLKFQSYYFRGQPGQIGRDTLQIKSNIILNEILHNDLEILEIWEDRPEHISGFFDFSKRIIKNTSLKKIIIHDVISEVSNEINP